MTEAEWLTGQDVDALLYQVAKFSPSERKGLLYVVASSRLGGSPPDCAPLLDGLEQYADGWISRAELDAIYRGFRNGQVFPGVPFDKFTVENAALLHAPHTPETDTAAQFIRCIFGNPFSSVVVDPAWLTSTVVALAEGIYADRAFDRMPILADALQDAGCDNEDVLNHCRQPGEHVRGCWVVDMLTGRK